ncbi:hypothetical protein ACZ90_58080 [Streptomyces albus subsp. albus]|nr:hypothetical protein ACZ90_58080 [Streptomyces albus subsp. albus]
MRRARYDQRVLALVEVRGGARDWAEAEEVFGAHGWPVIEHFPRGEGLTEGALAVDPAVRMYRVEVRLLGAVRRAETGAVWRLSQAAKGARLEMYVRRAERLDRDRELLPVWRVHTTAHRSAPLRRLRRYAMRRGRYDTGAMVLGSPREAIRLSRTGLPDGSVRRTDVAVRPLDGRAGGMVASWREEELERRLSRLVVWLVALVSCAVLGARISTGARYLWWGLAALSLCGVLWTGTGVRRGGSRSRAADLLVTTWAVFVVLAGALGFGDAPSLTRTQALLIPVILAVVCGLWLLARQWTWGEWVAWAVPLVGSLLVSSFVGAGSVLHALYAEGLSLTADDLDVPMVWQVVSAGRLLTYLSLVLLPPALWGMARHFHYVRTGERFNGVLYVLILALCGIGVFALAKGSADTAAQRAVAAARHRVDAPAYFGVEPEWTCVRPAVKAESLPSEGGLLEPAHPYLLMGVAGGNAVLLQPGTGEPLKVPAGKVRLVPAATARVSCRA